MSGDEAIARTVPAAAAAVSKNHDSRCGLRQIQIPFQSDLPCRNSDQVLVIRHSVSLHGAADPIIVRLSTKEHRWPGRNLRSPRRPHPDRPFAWKVWRWRTAPPPWIL